MHARSPFQSALTARAITKRTTPKLVRKLSSAKRMTKKRKEAYSQGKTDWFSTAGLAEVTSVSQPASTLAEETISAPSTSGAQSKPAKRKCLDDNTDDSSEEEEIPRLTVHIEEGIRNAIQRPSTPMRPLWQSAACWGRRLARFQMTD